MGCIRFFGFGLTALAAACSGGGDSVEEGVQDMMPAQIATADVQQIENGEQSASTPASGQTRGRQASVKALPDGAVRVKRIEIIDRHGFEKPMAAMTMLVPADWQGKGGIVWGHNTNCGAGSGYTTDFYAASPDGLSRAHLFPSYTWVWNNFSGGAGAGGCPFLQIRNVEGYLNYLVSQTRGGARVLDFRPRPDIAATYKQLESNMPMAGGEMRSWVESGEVLIAYNENGTELRESIAAAVVFNMTIQHASMGMPASEIITGAAMPGFAMRAPSGQLDFEFTEMLRKTIRQTPEWSQRIARHNSKIAQTNLKGARDRSRIIAQTGEEIRQIQSDTWRTQSESFDRMSRETSESIRGVETYNDPYYGGTVELDHTYDSAWQLNDGTYVLTNDTMFEPFRDLGVDGQRLKAVE
ncbi:hypothetical protein PUV54_14460 [Hyphococcus flavus]|uniref:Uncharacterized protein n=1 Tax=Hyphococcus flavus TaxID=1866326 RepID=A0AAF0CBK0_9PROT|nr:hypothetical protein [Hyphococcus flavus]WDI31150.1 hypothetical protein PUV54_14460 [Hyphococcus flavus]